MAVQYLLTLTVCIIVFLISYIEHRYGFVLFGKTGKLSAPKMPNQKIFIR